MKTNCKYMQEEEFKERQASFEFFCAQAFDFLVKFRRECRKGWEKAKNTLNQISKQQLTLCFSERIKKYWAEWTPEQNYALPL